MPAWMIRDAYYYFAWDRLEELAEYDVVVQSGNSPWWYVPRDQQTVVRYVHSPPRSPYDRYLEVGTSRLTRMYSRVVRTLIQPTLSFADVYVANSDLVARRIEKYLGVDGDRLEVVYPPVNVDGLGPREREDYYVALSRLDFNKGFEEILEAVAEVGVPLKVVGEGRKEADVKERARELGASVEFTGWVSEERKAELLGSARALLYGAENEDFGIVPIEALASGTPVIGPRDGFTEFQLEHGVDGLLYDVGEEKAANLTRALERFEREGVSASRQAMVEKAAYFRPERFAEEMRSVVSRAREGAEIEPKYQRQILAGPAARDAQEVESALSTDGGGA